MLRVARQFSVGLRGWRAFAQRAPALHRYGGTSRRGRPSHHERWPARRSLPAARETPSFAKPSAVAPSTNSGLWRTERRAAFALATWGVESNQPGTTVGWPAVALRAMERHLAVAFALRKRRRVEARAGIGRLSSRLHLQNGRTPEVTKHNQQLLAVTDSNSFGVHFGVRRGVVGGSGNVIAECEYSAASFTLNCRA